MAPQTVDAPATSQVVAPGRPRPRSASSWWATLAAASVVACVAHVPVTQEHLREAPYVGALFIALEIAAVVLASTLVIRPTAFVYGLTSALGGVAVGALVVSRTVGLPLIGDDIGNWIEPLAVVSLVAETVMFVGGFVALRADSTTRRRGSAGVVVGVLVLSAGLGATWLAAGAEGSGGHSELDMPGTHMGTPATHVDMPGMHEDMSGGQTAGQAGFTER